MDEWARALNLTPVELVEKLERLLAIDAALTAANVSPEQLATFLQMGSLLVERDQANQMIAKLHDQRAALQADIDAQIITQQRRIDEINAALRPQDRG